MKDYAKKQRKAGTFPVLFGTQPQRKMKAYQLSTTAANRIGAEILVGPYYEVQLLTGLLRADSVKKRFIVVGNNLQVDGKQFEKVGAKCGVDLYTEKR